MDALTTAWREATWTERLILSVWSLFAAAFFTVGTRTTADVTWLASGITGLVFGGVVFVAIAPKISGQEQRHRED